MVKLARDFGLSVGAFPSVDIGETEEGKEGKLGGKQGEEEAHIPHSSSTPQKV